MLSEEYFVQTINEFKYIKEFKEKYGELPDKETFISKFPSWTFFEVKEPTRALVDTIREEALFRRSVSVFNEASELFQKDANEGAQWLINAVNRLQPSYSVSGIDIISQARIRYEEWKKKLESDEAPFIPIKFKELNDILFGLQKGNDLVVFNARISQGKSFVLTAIAEHACDLGYRVGFISPEMSANGIAYRFDSSRKHFSNQSLMRGEYIKDYEKYIDELSKSNQFFFVSTQKDFQGKITPVKLRNYCKALNLDMLVIDGLKYVTCSYPDRTDTREDRIGKACTELLELSEELGIPVVVVNQANRKTNEKGRDGLPTLENLAGADEIGQIATRVITMRKNASAMEMLVAKNRYGQDNVKLLYSWDVDSSQWFNIPLLEDMQSQEQQKELEENKVKFRDVF